MQIVHIPDNILHKKTKRVPRINDAIRKIISEMKHVMDLEKDPEGVGLSANQVGLNYSMFVMKPSEKADFTVCINPIILEEVEKKKTKTTKRKNVAYSKLEGCLSIPGIWGYVERYQRVLLEYSNTRGDRKRKWFTGFPAVIVQHEVDHLNGILFTQRVVEQGEKLYKEIDGEFVPYRV